MNKVEDKVRDKVGDIDGNKVKGPQSQILHTKARSSAHAPAYIKKKCAIPAASRVA